MAKRTSKKGFWNKYKPYIIGAGAAVAGLGAIIPGLFGAIKQKLGLKKQTAQERRLKNE